MNPTAEDILNQEAAEACLTPTQKQLVITAMEEYSLLKSKEAASEAFDAGKRYGGKWANDPVPDKETYMKKYDTTGS